MNWHDKKILVLGSGDTGLSVVRWGTRVGARLRVADTRSKPPGANALRQHHPDIELVCGDDYTQRADEIFRDAELIIASPGVALAGPACDAAVARALKAGQEIIGDVELYARNFARIQNEISGAKPNVIGITGSNGKSTVTAMAEVMCRAAGLRTVAAGNIGLPVLDALLELPQPDVYVLELSSFQLEATSSLNLQAATMLNLTQDHLDRYASMQDYAAAKQRIFLHAKQQVLNREDSASMAMNTGNAVTFGIDVPPTENDFGIANGNLCCGSEVLMRVADMPVAGLHNAANALAALALCRSLGLEFAPLIKGLKSFRGLPHRVELVASIHGVKFYDDSKGTNVGSTAAALNGMTQPVILIAGGEGKEQDFSLLTEPIRQHAKAVVLIGKDARLIESAITSSQVQCIHANSMSEAVKLGYSRASPGDVVLLSPACASFDMFDNYKHRGEVFAKSVRTLKLALLEGDDGHHAL